MKLKQGNIFIYVFIYVTLQLDSSSFTKTQ